MVRVMLVRAGSYVERGGREVLLISGIIGQDTNFL